MDSSNKQCLPRTILVISLQNDKKSKAASRKSYMDELVDFLIDQEIARLSQNEHEPLEPEKEIENEKETIEKLVKILDKLYRLAK